MRIRSLFLLLFALFTCSLQAQSDLAFQPDQIRLEWELIENQHQGKSQSLSRLTLTNEGKTPVPASGWSIYFNFGRSLLNDPLVATGYEVKQISGDWFRLRPTDKFGGIAPGKSWRLDWVSTDWLVHRTDAPNGFYVVFDREPDTGYPMPAPAIKAPADARKLQRSPDDKKLPVTPADVYEQNKAVGQPDRDNICPVFPTPLKWGLLPGGISVNQNTPVWIDPAFAKEAQWLYDNWRYWLGGINIVENPPASGVALVVRKSNEPLPDEAYTLSITNERGIEIMSYSPAGAFYGMQSLASLFDPEALQQSIAEQRLPCLEMIDQPRFAYRGMHIDVARNFQPKAEILKMLDAMAMYKLNVLHFHFSDDEGWRIEIPGLPELTRVGARRGHTLKENEFLHPSYGSGPVAGQSSGSGYYTRQDFIEILEYAAARHIRVIPEIELPGHARAAIKSMDARYERLMAEGRPDEARRYLLRDPEDRSTYRSVQWYNDNVVCVALPSTFAFIDKVTDELLAMYRAANAPIETIHLGGDEVPGGVWEKSPVCRQLMKEQQMNSTDELWYFFWTKLDGMMAAKGLAVSGWEEAGLRKTQLDGQAKYIPNPDFTGKGFRMYVWNNVIGWGAEDLAYRMANAGYKVVLGPVSNLYFDMAYQKHFEEPGYYWGAYTDTDQAFSFAPFDYFKTTKTDRMGNAVTPGLFAGKDRLTDYGKGNILGIQGLIWSETLTGPEDLEYMVLPKMLGLAERAWAPAPDWESARDAAQLDQQYRASWTGFAHRVGQVELPRLDYLSGGFNYRIPTPGAVLKDGMVYANIQFPGLTLRYTTDGTEPTANSTVYNAPFKAVGKVKLRAFDRRGRGSRTVQVGN